jgi:hypothetical protein
LIVVSQVTPVPTQKTLSVSSANCSLLSFYVLPYCCLRNSPSNGLLGNSTREVMLVCMNAIVIFGSRLTFSLRKDSIPKICGPFSCRPVSQLSRYPWTHRCPPRPRCQDHWLSPSGTIIHERLPESSDDDDDRIWKCGFRNCWQVTIRIYIG